MNEAVPRPRLPVRFWAEGRMRRELGVLEGVEEKGIRSAPEVVKGN
jgi:hypothetical protein